MKKGGANTSFGVKIRVLRVARTAPRPHLILLPHHHLPPCSFGADLFILLVSLIHSHYDRKGNHPQDKGEELLLFFNFDPTYVRVSL